MVKAPPGVEGGSTADDGTAVTRRVLEIVGAVVGELKPAQAALAIGPETSLDRDLGLDSLARVEIAGRIESAFGVVLPDEAVAGAERICDLAAGVLLGVGVPPEPAGTRTTVAGAAGAGVSVPADARTLADVLDWYATRHPDRTHVRFWEDDADGETLTYGGLHAEARAIAAGLQACDVVPGEAVAIMLPTGRGYLAAFCGVQLAGAIAVPIFPPARATRIAEHLQRHAGILDNAQARVLIVTPDAQPLASVLHAQVASLRRVASVDELSAYGDRPQRTAVAAEAPALLQYTSGSTGAPKGVTLSHANLLANIGAMAAALQARPDDVFVSWLPLYHDMGLIGAWLGSLHQATPLVLMSPLAFLARPARWLRAIDRHRGTLSGGPNFAWELLLRHVRDEELRTLDLSCWRVAFTGAEPVSAATVERFCARFAAAGFQRKAMAPVYGLAENCVGLAFPPLGRGLVIDRIRRDDLARSGRAVPAAGDDAAALGLVACGRALPGHDIRIVDPAGFELPERREGRLQFRGPSATRGYWRNDAATRRLLDGDWRNSGDLAYLAGGDVHITARVKDLIIRGGRNIHPADIEEGAGAIDGVLPGRIAAFGDADAGSGTERLIVLAETRRREPETLERLRAEINAAVTALAGGPPDEVMLAPPNTIPRTSSGKIRRQATHALWRAGRIGGPVEGRTQQRLRLAAATAVGQGRRAVRTAAGLLFAGWAWTALAVLTPPAWLGSIVLPRRSWRWWAISTAARLLFRTTGTPLDIRGLENLPQSPCVLVANHASYLDVLALTAVLPRPVAFVAKAELQGSWLTRLPLRRIGTCFVERFDRRKGLEDYRRVAAAAREGRSPLFFPEGTFRRTPGLMPFRMGAFVCAVDAGLPVVPIGIRGTREILRGDSRVPRPGSIGVAIAPAVSALSGSQNWAAAIALRDRVRAVVLGLSGEQDARDALPFARTPAETAPADAL